MCGERQEWRERAVRAAVGVPSAVRRTGRRGGRVSVSAVCGAARGCGRAGQALDPTFFLPSFLNSSHSTRPLWSLSALLNNVAYSAAVPCSPHASSAAASSSAGSRRSRRRCAVEGAPQLRLERREAGGACRVGLRHPISASAFAMISRCAAAASSAATMSSFFLASAAAMSGSCASAASSSYFSRNSSSGGGASAIRRRGTPRTWRRAPCRASPPPRRASRAKSPSCSRAASFSSCRLPSPTPSSPSATGAALPRIGDERRLVAAVRAGSPLAVALRRVVAVVGPRGRARLHVLQLALALLPHLLLLRPRRGGRRQPLSHRLALDRSGPPCL